MWYIVYVDVTNYEKHHKYILPLACKTITLTMITLFPQNPAALEMLPHISANSSQ